MVDMVYIVGLVVMGYYLNLVLVVDVVMMIIYKILCGLWGGMILFKFEELGKKFNLVVFLGM